MGPKIGWVFRPKPKFSLILRENSKKKAITPILNLILRVSHVISIAFNRTSFSKVPSFLIQWKLEELFDHFSEIVKI